MSDALIFKQGATIGFECTYGGSLVGYDIDCQVRDANKNLIHEFDVDVQDAEAGTFLLVPVSSSLWPVGRLQFDIKYVYDGNTIYTDTGYIEIIRAVTQ